MNGTGLTQWEWSGRDGLHPGDLNGTYTTLHI